MDYHAVVSFEYDYNIDSHSGVQTIDTIFNKTMQWEKNMFDNPAGLLAFRKRVWPFGWFVWSAGSPLWVCYQPRFETQWGCWCRGVTSG